MQKRYSILSLLNLSLLISTSSLCTELNNDDQLNQASLELEGCMNDEFDDLDTSRSGKIDKDYDAICDQTPLKSLPKWQKWLNSVGGTIMLRTVLLKRFIELQIIALKNNISSWWNGKQKITSCNSNGYQHGTK